MFLKKGFFNLKNRLIHIGEKEPLNFFSIILILGLDIFVLVNIFQGLDMQTRQLVSPYEKIPYACQNLIDIQSPTDEKIVILNILRKDNDYYSQNNYKYSQDFINEKEKSKIDPMCREVFDVANTLRQNSTLQTQKSQISNIQKENDTYQSQINQYRGDYDTMLQERQAGQSPENSIISGTMDDVKININELNNKIDSNDLRISNIEDSILTASNSKNFLNIVTQNKQLILDKKKSIEFWYPLKKTGVEFLFLLPLLIFFIFLHKRSLKKEKELMIFITAHLLVVVSIPILFEIIRLTLDILPFHILADLLSLLEALNLIVIWTYLLILLGIGVTLSLIYLVQKKLFSQKRLYLKRIAHQQCYSCGTKQTENAGYCYKCGAAQYKKCLKCKKQTYQKGTYCKECGEIDQTNEE